MKPEELSHLRHSSAHLLAAAVLELYPGTKQTIGPAIENGFYYDFEFASPISEKDLQKIEQKMRELIKTWSEFEKIEVTKAEALKQFKDNEYKRELIEEFSSKDEQLTLYKSGNYIDLCRGGHSENPKKEIKHFKLLSVAGAYWRGDEKNKMLTRIYGTTFATKEDLEKYLWQREEAEKRDHRKLGRELELFFIDETVGKGLIMWLPKGTIVRDEIEKLARKKEYDGGYVRVVTPHIAREELFLKSGHLPYYKDSMYPPMKMDDGTYYLKAMNCPHHHRIFQHKKRSYKELPLRIAEYGTCYRNELSGTLAGLLRVRGMSMNDAHIYTTKEQIKKEFESVLKLTMEYFQIFGLTEYWFRLSKWDPKNKEKYIDEPENWEYSQKVLREVLQELNLPFVEADDEAAFYGPKVDVQFKSVIGREETMSTIQLDFAAKKRFGLSYVDETGQDSPEIFVIHRAPLSVHERFLAFLIEHYAGAFPLWLSPVQVRVLTISDKFNEFGKNVNSLLQNAGIRSEFDEEQKTVGYKIRQSTLQKIPYMVIIGEKEIEKSKVESPADAKAMAGKSKSENIVVSVRTREGKDLGQLNLYELITKLKTQIEKYA